MSSDKIHIYGEIHIDKLTPHMGKCEGILNMNGNNIFLPPTEITLRTNGVYPITFDVPYDKSKFSENGILTLKVTFGNQKPHNLKTEVMIDNPRIVK